MRQNEIIKEVDVVLDTQFYSDVMCCVKARQTEVCGVGLVRVEDGGEKLVVHGCELLPMDLGAGHADIPATEVTKWLEKVFEPKGATPYLTWCHWHSHPGSGNSPSGTDQKNLDGLVSRGLLVSLIFCKDGKFSCNVDSVVGVGPELKAAIRVPVKHTATVGELPRADGKHWEAQLKKCVIKPKRKAVRQLRSLRHSPLASDDDLERYMRYWEEWGDGGGFAADPEMWGVEETNEAMMPSQKRTSRMCAKVKQGIKAGKTKKAWIPEGDTLLAKLKPGTLLETGDGTLTIYFAQKQMVMIRFSADGTTVDRSLQLEKDRHNYNTMVSLIEAHGNVAYISENYTLEAHKQARKILGVDSAGS